MGRRVDFPGIKVYVDQLNKLTNDSLTIIEKAAAKGAAPIADACKANLNGLSASSNRAAMAAWRKGEKSPLTDVQKEGLIDSMGLAPMRNDNGYINTKLGFDGYNKVVTKRWPKGQPNAMIARVLESGSSAMEKQPFIRPAVNAKKSEAEKIMQETLDKEIQKIIK